MFADESKTRFRWYVTKDPTETGSDPTQTKKLKVDGSKWVERGEGFFFTPEPADIGRLYFRGVGRAGRMALFIYYSETSGFRTFKRKA